MNRLALWVFPVLIALVGIPAQGEGVLFLLVRHGEWRLRPRGGSLGRAVLLTQADQAQEVGLDGLGRLVEEATEVAAELSPRPRGVEVERVDVQPAGVFGADRGLEPAHAPFESVDVIPPWPARRSERHGVAGNGLDLG